MDIPKDKAFPEGAIQCDDCGGLGCPSCGDRGWFSEEGHPTGRRCAWSRCGRPISPRHVAVYCSNRCALLDSDVSSFSIDEVCTSSIFMPAVEALACLLDQLAMQMPPLEGEDPPLDLTLRQMAERLRMET